METDAPIVTALVPAAGSGTRMGGPRKQYRSLEGDPLLVRTLRRVANSPRVRHLVVAAPPEDLDYVSGLLQEEHSLKKVYAVVPGGDSRQASVRAALEAIPPETDIILVHDGVRPFVPISRIAAVVEAAHRTGAAALALPVTDTLRRGEAGIFGETVPREGLFRMQTPQAFRATWFVAAHARAVEDGWAETDDAALVQRTGRPVAIVEGDPTNIKVTTPADWDLAELLWRIQEEAANA